MLMIERWTTLKGFFQLPMCLLSISENNNNNNNLFNNFIEDFALIWTILRLEL